MNRSRHILTPALAALAVAAPVTLAVTASSAQAATADAIALPASSQLVTALETIVSPSAASSISSDVTRVASSATTANITTLDQALNTILTSALTLPAKTATAAASLESTLSGLSALAPANATAAQLQTVAELRTALTDAGMSTLLSGLGSSASSATSQLAELPSLNTAGSTIPSGLLGSVGAVVSTLASEAGSGSTDSATLTSVAATLDSTSGVTATQLLGAVTALQSVTSTTASGTSGATVAQVAAALATALSQANALLGALAAYGSPLSALSDPTDLATANGEVTNLAGLVPGVGLSLPGLSDVFNAIAATPGVSGAVTSELESVATSLDSNNVAPSTVLSDVSTLETMTGLPSQLETLLSSLTLQLSGSGAVLGTITGVTNSEQTAAMTDLANLAKLGAGNSTGELPGLGAVLNLVSSDIANVPANADTRTAVEDLAVIMQTNSMNADQLYGAAEVVSYAGQALSGTAAATTLSQLTTALTQDAVKMGGSASVTPTSLPTSVSTTTTPTARLSRVTRFGNSVTATLSCATGTAGSCIAVVRASESGAKAITETITIAPGTSQRITITLKPRKQKAIKGDPASLTRRPIWLLLRSAATRVAKTVG